MSLTAPATWPRAPRPPRRGARVPVLAAFATSRLLVLAAGCAGALAVPRRNGWQGFDLGLVSSHLGSAGNVLGAAAVRWDAIHYLAIAGHGYTSPADSVFYPLYPVLVRLLGWLLGSEPLAGAAISLGAFLLALHWLARLSELELGPRAARATTVLLAFAPLAFFFSAVYTESLFLALSVGCLYAARTGRWSVAVACAALASVPRVTGAVLVVPLAMWAWAESPRPWRRVAGLAAVPAALAAYLGYLVLAGLRPWDPFTAEAVYGRISSGPLGTLVRAVQWGGGGLRLLVSGVETVYMPSIRGPLSFGAESLMLLAVLALGLVTLRLVWQRLPRPYGAFAGLSLAVCLWSPSTSQPLMSFDRYALTIFPLWMAGGAWLAERERRRVAVTALSAALLAFFAFQFATWAFVA